MKTWSKIAIAALSFGLSASAPVWAANEGTALGVDPNAAARGGSGERTLVVGSEVSVGERVVTGPTGQVQLVFLDNTRLVVGPGSSLVIESYLLRGGGSAEKFAINALGGTFRFISGNSPKSAYDIRTPSATIGVRGTEFDLVVGSGESRVMLYGGALQVCAGASCVQVTERCAVATAAGSARLYLRNDPDRQPLVRVFRYAAVQSPLLAPFRVSGANRCLEELETGPPQSLSDFEPSELPQRGQTPPTNPQQPSP